MPPLSLKRAGTICHGFAKGIRKVIPRCGMNVSRSRYLLRTSARRLESFENKSIARESERIRRCINSVVDPVNFPGVTVFANEMYLELRITIHPADCRVNQILDSFSRLDSTYGQCKSLAHLR